MSTGLGQWPPPSPQGSEKLLQDVWHREQKGRSLTFCLVPLTHCLTQLWQQPSGRRMAADLWKQERVQADEGCGFPLKGLEQNATGPLYYCQSGLHYSLCKKVSRLFRKN